jgi:sugar phosphate isomerase/epimerase
MKVGIVHFMAFPQVARGEQVVETIERIAEDDFFGAIEVTSIKDPATRAAAAKLLETSGLVVGYGAQPIELGEKLDINSVDPAKRAASVARLKLAVDEACELGAKRFAVLSGPFPGDEHHAAATKALVQSLDELCGYAKAKCGMPVVLEVFDRTIDKKSLIGPTAEGVALSAEVRKTHPSFGLMIDLSHLPLQVETARESLGAAGAHLVHAHIGNCVVKERSNSLYGDLHPRFDAPGGENGVAEVVDFLRELMAIGYIGDGKQNVVAFEVKPYGAETSGAVVAQAKRTLREAWARL